MSRPCRRTRPPLSRQQERRWRTRPPRFRTPSRRRPRLLLRLAGPAMPAIAAPGLVMRRPLFRLCKAGVGTKPVGTKPVGAKPVGAKQVRVSAIMSGKTSMQGDGPMVTKATRGGMGGLRSGWGVVGVAPRRHPAKTAASPGILAHVISVKAGPYQVGSRLFARLTRTDPQPGIIMLARAGPRPLRPTRLGSARGPSPLAPATRAVHWCAAAFARGNGFRSPLARRTEGP